MSIELSDRTDGESKDVWRNGRYIGIVEPGGPTGFRGRMTGVPGGGERTVDGTSIADAAMALVDLYESVPDADRSLSLSSVLDDFSRFPTGLVLRRYSPKTRVSALNPAARAALEDPPGWKKIGDLGRSLWAARLGQEAFVYARTAEDALSAAVADWVARNPSASRVG